VTPYLTHEGPAAFRHIAAEGGDVNAGRVRGIKEVDLLHGFLEGGGDDSTLTRAMRL